jgi:glycosyltransferase involved in cell wall biosynthesis
MALPYLKEFGWDATVLAVDAKYVEGLRDPLLEKTIPADTPIFRTRALPPKWTHLVGLGSLALRALIFLWREGNKLLVREPKFDLIFFSTTMFPTLVLGLWWKRKFRVPYIVDYQDPWISDYYDRTKQKPPGGRAKYWLSGILARACEPSVVRSADEFVVVSPKYTDDLLKTYPFLRRDQFTTLPFGAPELDFELLNKLRPLQPGPRKSCFNIAYVGAAGPFMATPLRMLFSAIAQSRGKHPQLWRNIRLKFIGTSYAPAGRAVKSVVPIAEEFGVNDLVEEQTSRLPYFDALEVIRDADGLLIIGSESSSYSPSKVYPYVLARRPTLAILHRESPAAEILRQCRAARIVEFGDLGEVNSPEMEAGLSDFIQDVQSDTPPAVDWQEFSQYSARQMTRQLVVAFNRVTQKRPHDDGRLVEFVPAAESRTIDHPQVSTRPIGMLFGHPTGNPNAHQAALAHYERGRLDAFCVSWIPTQREIGLLRRIPGLHDLAARIERRIFAPLREARVVQSRYREWGRMLRRIVSGSPLTDEAMAYDANDWLMRTMARECQRAAVTAVHSYEDCSLLQFQAAKKLGKACIYDMPIGYYPAWEETQRRLAREFNEWLPRSGLNEDRYVRPAQKKREMELADLVIGPSIFVARTIEGFHDKSFALAPYGVDSDFWHPGSEPTASRPLRFIYAGQASLRKGIPLLLMAWERAGLNDAELLLVGIWQLAHAKRVRLPPNVRYLPPCSAMELRKHYQSADCFVFPSYFEGFGLVLLEAMACGLPVISSEATAAPDFLTNESGWLIPAGNLEAWVEAIRDAGARRNELVMMKQAARGVAVANTWQRYRDAVSTAVCNLFS